MCYHYTIPAYEVDAVDSGSLSEITSPTGFTPKIRQQQRFSKLYSHLQRIPPIGYSMQMERETGLEPATSALARRRSTK